MTVLRAASSALRLARRAFHAVSAAVGTCENVVKVKWSDGVETQHNTTWLRHNCACAACVQRHSGQRLFQSEDLKVINKVTSLDITEDGCLRAASDEHVSMTPLQSLRTQRPAIENQPSCRVHMLEDVLNREEACFDWLNEVGYNGYAIVQGAGADEDAVVKLANRISHPQPTIYGTTFDVVSTPQPINIAYSTAGLALHQDLVYYESPPGLQFLHAVRFDSHVAGGASTLVDAFALATRFRQESPEYFDVLTRVPMCFQKIHYERELPVHIKSLKPIIRVDHAGEIVEVTWSPPFEGLLPATCPVDTVSAFYDAYIAFAHRVREWDDLLIERRLEAGEVLVFNNRRMLHGRRAFDLNTGHRHFKGVYVNINEFASRLNFMCIQRGVAPPSFYGDGQANTV